MNYFKKMRGTGQGPPGVRPAEIFWSWLGGFLGILAVGVLNYRVIEGTGYTMVIGSFGASAVLIYGAIKSPLAQPRNLLGGHFISALIGVASYKLFPALPWLAGALAVSLAIAAMHMTRTLHPPGGATAFIAVIGGESIHQLGFLYALIPALSGALVMLLIALLVNNIPRERRYPEFWI